MHNHDDDDDLVSRLLEEDRINRKKSLQKPFSGRGWPVMNGIMVEDGVLEARASYQKERSREAEERIALETKASEAPPDESPVYVPCSAEASPKEKVVDIVVLSTPPKRHETTDQSSTAVFLELPVELDEVAPAALPQDPLYEIQFFMERPFFAIPAKGAIEMKPYFRDGLSIQTRALDPSLGVATIDDAEILMVIGTELFAAMMKDPSCREVTLQPGFILQRTRRKAGGNQYSTLQEGLDRLSKTEVTTNIGPNGSAGKAVTFTFLKSWEASTKRLITVRVSNWVAAAIALKKAIRISDHYFRSKKGLERWLFRVAWKHMGSQTQPFVISLPTLYTKSGSRSRPASFNNKIKEIVKRDPLPDFALTWIDDPRGTRHKLKISRRDTLPTEFVPEAVYL